LQAKTKDLLGKVEIIGPVKSWPLVSYATSSLYNNNILLIAEAAHALHPMGAQGLNLSLRDVQSLTDHLVRGRRLGLPVNAASIINSYTQERMNDIRSRRFSTDMLNRYSRLQSGLTGAIAKNIKQVGFRILGQNQLVRNHLMTLGTGHTMLPSVKRKRFL
jgi:2-octaprenyl-6-methoxyphenol hydroxylase